MPLTAAGDGELGFEFVCLKLKTQYKTLKMTNSLYSNRGANDRNRKVGFAKSFWMTMGADVAWWSSSPAAAPPCCPAPQPAAPASGLCSGCLPWRSSPAAGPRPDETLRNTPSPFVYSWSLPSWTCKQTCDQTRKCMVKKHREKKNSVVLLDMILAAAVIWTWSQCLPPLKDRLWASASGDPLGFQNKSQIQMLIPLYDDCTLVYTFLRNQTVCSRERWLFG